MANVAIPEVIQEGSIVVIPRVRIRPKKGQPRSYFNKQKLDELGESILLIGQMMAILVKQITDDPVHDYELIDGERRLAACVLKNIPTMRAEVRHVASEDDHFLMSVVANFGKEGHTLMETARALERVRTMGEGKTIAELAKIFVHSTTWVSQHLSLLKLAPEVQRLLEPETPEEQRLSLTTALLLVNLPHKMQIDLALAISQKGMRMNQARHFIREDARKKGLSAGSSARSPYKDYGIFSGVLFRLENDLDMLLDTSMRSFQQMFEKRNPADRQHIITVVDNCIEQLGQIKDVLSHLSGSTTNGKEVVLGK